MIQETTYEQESLMDVCIRLYKSPEAFVRMCADNNVGVDSMAQPGQVVSIDKALSFKKAVGVESPLKTSRSQEVILERQLIVDMCLQAYGSIESLVAFCNDNGIAISDTIIPGTPVRINKANIVRASVVDYLKRKELKISTGDTIEEYLDNVRILEDDTILILEDGTARGLE